jgi:hypothetical protein
LCSADDEPEAARQRPTQLIAHHQELEKVSTWPIDSSIGRRFTRRNLGLFAGYVVGHMSF